MDQINKDALLKDLQFIKEAARKNNNIFKFINISEGIKNVALFSGVFIVTFSLIFQWLIEHYGSFQELPNMVKAAVYVFPIISVVGIVFFKIKVFLKLGKKYKNDMNLIMLLKEIYTSTFVIIMIQFIIAIAVLCVFLPISGMSHLIVPILSIVVSLLMVSVMTFFNLKDFLFIIEWLLISGSFSLFVADHVSTPVLTILTFGVGMLILYLSAHVSILREKRDRVGRK